MTDRFLLFILILIQSVAFAQDEGRLVSENHDDSFHSLSLVMASAFMHNSFSETTNDVLIVPGFGLNYDYQINKRWGVGFHTDILLQQFKIEKHGSNEEVIRENPVSVVAILFFKPYHRWKVVGGYGIELEKNENFQLIRIGVEYGIDLPKSWELGFIFENNFKIDGYYTLFLGIGFTKKFVSKND